MTLLQETSTLTICEKNRYVVELNSKFNVGTVLVSHKFTIYPFAYDLQIAIISVTVYVKAKAPRCVSNGSVDGFLSECYGQCLNKGIAK